MILIITRPQVLIPLSQEWPSNTSIIGAVQPGSIKFVDLNNDGVVDITNDRKIIGDPTPKCTGGLNQQFTYKQWDLSLFMNFSIGNDNTMPIK
ncbi:MAG: hypothetical protein IPM85_00285 [Chitinophagaceae bacterium]|nr:hypothetical protein [Chitinophagaceae bacterium]